MIKIIANLSVWEDGRDNRAEIRILVDHNQAHALAERGVNLLHIRSE